MTALKMRVRFARGTGGSMHMATVPEYLRRTFTQGQWSAECPLCPPHGYPTQYRPSFRAALDYADEHARSHAGHVDARAVTDAIYKALASGGVGAVQWGHRVQPWPATCIHIACPGGLEGDLTLRLVTEDTANTHPAAVPGWSWAGDTEPLRDRAGHPLGCDATPEQVADAVLANTEALR